MRTNCTGCVYFKLYEWGTGCDYEGTCSSYKNYTPREPQTVEIGKCTSEDKSVDEYIRGKLEELEMVILEKDEENENLRELNQKLMEKNKALKETIKLLTEVMCE